MPVSPFLPELLLLLRRHRPLLPSWGPRANFKPSLLENKKHNRTTNDDTRGFLDPHASVLNAGIYATGFSLLRHGPRPFQAGLLFPNRGRWAKGWRRNCSSVRAPLPAQPPFSAMISVCHLGCKDLGA